MTEEEKAVKRLRGLLQEAFDGANFKIEVGYSRGQLLRLFFVILGANVGSYVLIKQLKEYYEQLKEA